MRMIACAAAVLLPIAAAAEPPGEPTLADLPMPRPAYPRSREALGQPAPRDDATVLAEIDDLSARLPSLEANVPEDPAAREARGRQIVALRLRRADLVKELFENGWTMDISARRPALLRAQVEDLAMAWNYFDAPARIVEQTLQHIVSTRRDNPAESALADRAKLIRALSTMQDTMLRVNPSDLERFASVEEHLPADDPHIGALLAGALSMCDDPDAVRRWEAWMVETLPETSPAVREIRARGLADRPITLTGVTFDGTAIDTSSWKGSVVVVDFWGTWCGPCIAGMPKLKALQERHGADDLRILGVLCDHDVDKAERFLASKGYGWPQLVDRTLTPRNLSHPVAKEHGITAFPTYWLIDRKGVLRNLQAGPHLEAEVEKLLAERE